MDKIYNISDIQFDNDYLIIKVDNSILKVRISDASNKLANASDFDRNDYKVSPSGYGIHWNRLDEDLSINGLLKLARSVNGYTSDIDIARLSAWNHNLFSVLKKWPGESSYQGHSPGHCELWRLWIATGFNLWMKDLNQIGFSQTFGEIFYLPLIIDFNTHP